MSFSPGWRSAISSMRCMSRMERERHDRHARLLRLRPQPVEAALRSAAGRRNGRCMVKRSPSMPGCLRQAAIFPRDSGASGSNRPMTAKRSGYFCAAARQTSLRSPSHDGGTSTHASTPAASISRSSSSAASGSALRLDRLPCRPRPLGRVGGPDVHLRIDDHHSRVRNSRLRCGDARFLDDAGPALELGRDHVVELGGRAARRARAPSP